MYLLIILIIILIWICNCRTSTFTGESDEMGFIGPMYMDKYKWLIAKPNQKPYVLFEAVNTIHPGDELQIWTNNNWQPVANIISIIEVDAYCVIVLDKPVDIYLQKFRTISLNDKTQSSTIVPNIIKTPYHEIESISRYIRPPGDTSGINAEGVRAPYIGNWFAF